MSEACGSGLPSKGLHGSRQGTGSWIFGFGFSRFLLLFDQQNAFCGLLVVSNLRIDFFESIRFNYLPLL